MIVKPYNDINLFLSKSSLVVIMSYVNRIWILFVVWIHSDLQSIIVVYAHITVNSWLVYGPLYAFRVIQKKYVRIVLASLDNYNQLHIQTVADNSKWGTPGRCGATHTEGNRGGSAIVSFTHYYWNHDIKCGRISKDCTKRAEGNQEDTADEKRWTQNKIEKAWKLILTYRTE